MKKYLFVFASTIFFLTSLLNSFASEKSQQKYYTEKSQLHIELDSINSQITDTNFFDLKRLVAVQSKIMELDKNIISVLEESAENLKVLQNKFEEVEKEHKRISSDLGAAQNKITTGLYIGAALIIILLIFVIMFLIKLAKANKLKKELAQQSLLTEEYKKKTEEFGGGIDNLIEIETAHKEALHKINNLEQSLIIKESEIKKLSEKNAEFDSHLEERKKDLQSVEVDYEKRIADLEETVKDKEQQIKEKLKHDKSKLADELSIMTRNWEDEKLQVIALKKEIESYINDIKLLKEHGSEKTQVNKTVTDTILKDDMAALQSQLVAVRKELAEKTQELENTTTSKEKNSEEEIETSLIETNNNQDCQALSKENDILKTELEAYKKLLEDELEVRKEILSFIEELKTLR